MSAGTLRRSWLCLLLLKELSEQRELHLVVKIKLLKHCAYVYITYKIPYFPGSKFFLMCYLYRLVCVVPSNPWSNGLVTFEFCSFCSDNTLRKLEDRRGTPTQRDYRLLLWNKQNRDSCSELSDKLVVTGNHSRSSVIEKTLANVDTRHALLLLTVPPSPSLHPDTCLPSFFQVF